MKVKKTNAEWADIVSKFKQSGQTQVQFCKEHGINPKTLGNRLRDNAGRNTNANTNTNITVKHDAGTCL